jgi:sugar phosphate isomerase/epimerase
MSSFHRRDFLQLSATLATGSLIPIHFPEIKNQILLSFSTLGCPEWNFSKITDFAVQHGYKGIEVRGILRQMDLPKCPEFSTEQSRHEINSLMKEKGLQFINLGSSAAMHFSDEKERMKNMDDGRRFIDLAQQLNCPFVRVFPNNFPKEKNKAETIELIISGLKEMGRYAAGKNVSVLMETHGDCVYTDDLEKIMQSVSMKNVGLVWDCCNMWTVTKEEPAYMHQRLKKYITHTHIKDARLVDGKPEYVFLGQGEVPIFNAMEILVKNKYKGYYSFEWEKLWHPELAEPELAFADYPLAIKKHFEK